MGLLKASAMPLAVPLELSSSGPLAMGHKREQRLDAGDGRGAGSGVRHEGEIAETELLAEAFVVAEEKRFVLLDRAAERTAEHVALERRNRAVVEVVAGIERAIAQEFVGVAVKLVGAGGGDDVDLRAGTLAVGGAVAIADHGKFAHGIDAK